MQNHRALPIGVIIFRTLYYMDKSINVIEGKIEGKLT